MEREDVRVWDRRIEGEGEGGRENVLSVYMERFHGPGLEVTTFNSPYWLEIWPCDF